MDATNNNIIEYVEGLELIPDQKYIVECGIEFTYKPEADKKYLLKNGISINHVPTKRDIGTNNLKPLTEQNYPDRKEVEKLGSLGGKKASENRQRKRNFQETARYFLSLKATKSQIKDNIDPAILANMTEEEIKAIDQQDIIIARALELAMAGSKDHLIILRDSAGDSPTDKVQSEVNIMTDSDRALMDKLSKRLNKEQDS